MKQYLLGVDGGQSSTTAMIGDASGHVIGMGRGGPSNHAAASEGRAKFLNAMNACLDAACGQAALDRKTLRFVSACLGFSGGPSDKEKLLPEVLASDRTIVTHDAEIALSGATAGEPGVIAIAGTGSIAFGRNAAGKTARAGGWGYMFGDEGGGFFITRQALRAALRFEEGWGEATSLRSALLDETGARDMNDLMHRFYTPEFPRPRVASLSKVVNQEAERGDEAARTILIDAGRELALLIDAVRSQLFENGEAARISYIGGVFRSSLLLEQFQQMVEAQPGVRFGKPTYGPAAGALIEAYHAAGIDCTLSNVPEEKV